MKNSCCAVEVTVPPQAISFHSMGGAQAAALDNAVDSDGESPFPKTSWHHVMGSSSKKTQLDPMWQTTSWLEADIKSLGEQDIPGSEGVRVSWSAS